ncbi:unnamed protein product [Fraxinus pennsylvanica]|uniref:Cysteine-rich receptor-like protein kinase n=1 Tax=Fraxinus pennsylvanica TaxID=56036 RepID=A0AAD2DHV2_9LAMI|nr:unnamed protein product [Fraxinus pennsylvanica]
MSSRKWLPNFVFVICLINLFVTVKSEFPTTIHFHYKCLDNGNYTSNSTYKTNLDTLLSTVSPNIDNNGFYNASTGENSDRVNVIALCRADLQPHQCRDYVKNATAEILKKCPNQKQVILWHEFCMVRYSNETIFGTLAYSPLDWGYSRGKVTNLDKFYQELNILLDSLRNQTAYNSYPRKFAAASRVNRNYETTYAFEQCTPDITPKECDDCLKKSVLLIRECCDEAGGVRILRPSCYLRFKTDFSFYNETMVEILQTPASPPPSPPPPPPGKKDNTTRTVIIVIVPSVVCTLMLAFCIGIILRTKKMRKPLEKIETDNETSTIESLQYDFSTIRTATENFSDANKLGRGGFGVVYKGKMPKGIEIAVKRLSRDLGQGDLEFKNENGSLDRFIFDPNMHPYLDWEKRYIIIGEETQHSTSRIVGTYGYMAPEYVIHGQFSVKSDVFSFGVLVLEIICGQKTNNFRNRESMDDLLSCVWKNWHEGTAANMIDPVLRASLSSLRDILRCIHIGLLCVQENAANRPTMASVVLMLSSSTLTLPVPLQPAFFVSGSFDQESSLPRENDSSKDQSNNDALLSTNDVSMTLVRSQSHWCLNNGNFTSNSMYKTNLDTLLSSISSNIDGNGFYNASNGENSDRVNAMALCRGDLQLDTCRSCINNATDALLLLCPHSKEAIFWAESGQCMLRYSSESIFGKLATEPLYAWFLTAESTSPEEFNRDLRMLLDNLRSQAAYGGALKKFAAANATGPDLLTIYGLAQCTPDLNSDDCSDCLIHLVEFIPQCCNGKLGFAAHSPSCLLRYEIYSFYDDTPQPAPPPPPLSVPIPAPPGKDDNTTQTIIIIIVPIIVGLIIALCIGIFLRFRRRHKPMEQLETQNEISTVESLYYNFGTIRAATDNFSDANMLRQGGSGIVYKGKLPSGQQIAVKRLSMISGGYMAPEYTFHRHFSNKPGVFRFGILVLEIVSGQKTSSFGNGENVEDLLSRAWKNWHKGTSESIIDPTLMTSSRSLRDIMRCIHIGLLCVQEDATVRPTMASIVLMLNNSSMTLPIPSQSAFFVSTSFDPEISLLR